MGILSGLEDGISYVHGFTTVIVVICNKSARLVVNNDSNEFLDTWG